MNKKSVNIKISFADSTFQSFETKDNSILIIKLISWDGKPIKIVFNRFIQFSYKLGDVPNDLYEVLNSTPFLEEALGEKYEKIPVDHLYKLFELEDIDDFPFIQVVAKSAQVLKE